MDTRVRWALWVTSVLLAGCSSFTPPKSKPVIEDRVTDWGLKKVSVLATTPERRVVLVKIPDRLLCSEAPADIAESISSAITASLEAKGAGKVSEAEAGVSAQLATSLLQLTYRSQGLQLYRDASYHLCTLYMNEVLTKEEVKAAHERLLVTMTELIKLELPIMGTIRSQALASKDAPNLPPAAAKATDKSKEN